MEKPSVLFLDTHASDCDQFLIQRCRNNDVHLKFLPANTTHILHIKSTYDGSYEKWTKENKESPLTKVSFVNMMKLSMKEFRW